MSMLNKLLAKGVLIPLRLTAAASATDAGIHNVLVTGFFLILRFKNIIKMNPNLILFIQEINDLT